MGIGQNPFSVHVYAPERCQVVLQDQQLEARCHTPTPSSTVELTSKILSHYDLPHSYH